jgi:hypothetical protein
VAADGTARGFPACDQGVIQNPAIFYFYRPLGEGEALGGDSPYHGKVLATAWDGVSVTFGTRCWARRRATASPWPRTGTRNRR